MPTISPFGISDKNTYETKFIWHADDWFWIYIAFLYISPPYNVHVHTVFTRAVYLFLCMISLKTLIHPLISPFLTVMPKNKRIYTYIETPKWEMNSECTWRISWRVLSQFSCKILQVERATWTSAESSITWSAMEKLLSCTNVLEYVMCFCIESMLGRIMFWISTNVV